MHNGAKIVGEKPAVTGRNGESESGIKDFYNKIVNV